MFRFSLSVLRAFEAVGRNLSFSKAAQELRISQSAVSRHIATLELELNCRLLNRTTRNVSLTQNGSDLYSEIHKSLFNIERALNAARSESENSVISVSISPFLSVAWFTPRLLEFIGKNPDLEIKLTHDYSPPNFEERNIDVGLNWASKPTKPRIHAERIISGSLIPACSPEYAEKHLSIGAANELLNCTLFHEFKVEDWQSWFAENGVKADKVESQQISDTNALRRAAITGKGVALVFEALIQDDISAGNLISPIQKTIDTGQDYWLTYPIENANRPALKRFVRWVRKQSQT